MNSGNLHRHKNRLLAKAFTAIPWLASRWAEKLESDSDEAEIPWAQPFKPLSKARVAVITTGGVHLKKQTAFDMEDKEGDATWRAIPVDTPNDEIEITHDYYNQTDARKDLNLILPIERLRELQDLEVIGKLHDTAISFMGHIDGRHVETLNSKTAKEVAALLREADVDYALLVPA